MKKHWHNRQITCGLELAITEQRDDVFRYDVDGKALKTMSKNPVGHRVFLFCARFGEKFTHPEQSAS